jgi:hypothetical protein
MATRRMQLEVKDLDGGPTQDGCFLELEDSQKLWWSAFGSHSRRRAGVEA